MKQSATVIALLLGTSAAKLRKPSSNSLFATGMNEGSDIVADIRYGDYDTIKVGVKPDEPKEKAPRSTFPAAAQLRAAPAPAKAGKGGAAAAPVGKAVGCNPGETLGPDGNCSF